MCAEILPVQPTDFIVLTIGIVVTALGVAHLVSRPDHRNSLCHKKHKDGIAPLTAAGSNNVFFAGRSLHSVIAAEIPGSPVQIVLAVGFVVPVIVHKDIRKRKAVVAADKIDISERFLLLALLVDKILHIPVDMVQNLARRILVLFLVDVQVLVLLVLTLDILVKICIENLGPA